MVGQNPPFDCLKTPLLDLLPGRGGRKRVVRNLVLSSTQDRYDLEKGYSLDCGEGYIVRPGAACSCAAFFHFLEIVMQTVVLNVDVMNCGGCVKSVTGILQAVDGVASVKVSLKNKNATVSV